MKTRYSDSTTQGICSTTCNRRESKIPAGDVYHIFCFASPVMSSKRHAAIRTTERHKGRHHFNLTYLFLGVTASTGRCKN